jgi:aerobic carbon-monoxide dehydrogenase medium subunit
MKPASFEYHAPTTVDEALALLQANGPDCRVLAGGQTLIPMMNFRLASPPVIVDLNRIPDLAYIKDQGDAVCIGAMTRQRTIEFSTVVADKLPVLTAAIKLVGHLPTRSRGPSAVPSPTPTRPQNFRWCCRSSMAPWSCAGPGANAALPHPIFFRAP